MLAAHTIHAAGPPFAGPRPSDTQDHTHARAGTTLRTWSVVLFPSLPPVLRQYAYWQAESPPPLRFLIDSLRLYCLSSVVLH